ncbi:MAG: hypothetical protein JWN27_2900 [Candidatus Eremiobacteraeota bacterium]|nr:hypothetical protein [Candidatus Eremiobacteraeota bacterium]
MAQKIAIAAALAAVDNPSGAQMTTIDVDLRSSPTAGGFFSALLNQAQLGAIAPPAAPTTGAAVSGALAAHTPSVATTFLDANGGESLPSPVTVSALIPLNSVLTVTSPAAPAANPLLNVAATQYQVYACNGPVTALNPLTKQGAPINIGTNYQEPNTGITATGVQPPAVDTTGFVNGSVTITLSQP